MPAASASPVGQLLRQELARASEFIALLREEQTLLTSGKHDELEALAARKASGAEALGRMAAERDAALAQLRLPAGKPGMETWLTSPAGAQGRNDWLSLLKIAAEARALNEANGKIIAIHLQSNQQALTALMAASEKTATYGPDGHQHANVAKRSLGSI